MCLFVLQLTAATDRINSLREEQETLRKENESILQSSLKKEEVRTSHIHTLTHSHTHRLLLYNPVCVCVGDPAGQSGGVGDVQTDSPRSG